MLIRADENNGRRGEIIIMQARRFDLPITGLELDVNTLAVLVLLWRLLLVAGFLVDVDFFAVLGGAAVAVFFVDSNLLLVALVASVGG